MRHRHTAARAGGRPGSRESAAPVLPASRRYYGPAPRRLLPEPHRMTPLDRATFTAPQLAAAPRVGIRPPVADRGVAVVRGLFDRDDLGGVLARFKERFDSSQDARHDPRDSAAVRTNVQKLQLGANSGLNSLRTLGRFMR